MNWGALTGERRGMGPQAPAAQPAPVADARRWITTPAALHAVVALVAGLVAVQLQQSAATAPVAVSDFSVERAHRHVERIATVSHAMGTPANAQVRSYLLAELTALGARPEVQEAVAARRLSPIAYAAGHVQNVVARLDGTTGGPLVALVAHYDSAPHSPGAGDDGIGVATLLETARALRAGPPLQRGILLLFTDGEESGLLGAQAFIGQHRLAHDVGVVLNFDARGNSGPVLMFETGTDDGWLVEQMARARVRPITNSLLPEIYRLLGNETDFTMFRRANVPGLNFAAVGTRTAYHAPLDTAAGLDRRSLQDMGATTLSLVRQLDGANVVTHPRERRVWFQWFGRAVWSYPVAWAIPLTVACALILIAAGAFGYRRGLISLGGVAAGVGACVLALVAAEVLARVVQWGLAAADPSRAANIAYQQPLIVAGQLAFALAAASGAVGLIGARVKTHGLLAGVLAFWAIGAVTTAVLVPAASYAFLVPVACGAVGLWLMILASGRHRDAICHGADILLLSVPVVTLLVPVVLLVTLNTSLDVAGSATAAFALVCTLLARHFCLWPRRWLIPAVSGALGVVLIARAIAASGPSPEQPLRHSLFYLLDSPNKRAVWASLEGQPDEWTARLLTATPRSGGLWDYYPNARFFNNPAPALDLAPPSLRVLEATRDGSGERHVRLHLRSHRGAPVAFLYLPPGLPVLEASLDGVQLPISRGAVSPTGRWNVSIHGLPEEGVELAFTTQATPSIRLLALDQSYGLPAVPGLRLPPWLAPSPFSMSHATLVGTNHVIDPK
jgi:hypothetical protein